MKPQKKQLGAIMVYIIIIIAVFLIVTPPLLADFLAKMQLMRLSIQSEQALQIAEAGINYYQWHLAHYPTDYYDGTGSPGTYVHDYKDFDSQEIIGQFSLVITPPATGSTLITIQSTGFVSESPNIKRTITVKFGKPSLSKYAFVSQYPAWIYPSDTVNGLFAGNNGIRFEGATNAQVQSARTAIVPTVPPPPDSGYICSFGMCGSLNGGASLAGVNMPGIWAAGTCSGNCYCSLDRDGTVYNSCGGSTACCPDSMKFWQLGAPAVDFGQLTSTFSDMKGLANNGGIYLPASGKSGYSLVFNNDGTVTIYKVKNLMTGTAGRYYVYGVLSSTGLTDYGQRTLLSGYDHHALPANGIIYVEDNVWVEGTVKGRVTVAAVNLDWENNIDNAKRIYIPNNIVYSTKDGSDVLGLIAQRDIIYSYHAPTDLEVDAAEVTQWGSTQAPHFGDTSTYPVLKNSITTYGSIMSFDSWAWTWSNGTGSIIYSGFAHTINNYDSNLLYGPPPGFPYSSSDYQLLDWVSN